MIYTITCNPSLDYIMQVPSFTLGETNRSKKEEIFVGGKGFNVSTILHRLHLPTCAYGFIAGFSGQEIKRLLAQRGFVYRLIEVNEGFSRINVKMKGEKETEINGNGPMITENDLKALYVQLQFLQDGDTIVLSGSIPSCLQSNIYEQILSFLEGKNIRAVVDSTKDSLLRVLPYHPFLIKPNQTELEELFHCTIQREEELLVYAKKLQEAGARNVLISRASQGAILLDEHQRFYRCPCALGTLKNSVGAGDSMVAGFIAGYQRYESYEEALKLGTAAGGATAFSDDLGDEKLIMKLYTTIQVEEILGTS